MSLENPKKRPPELTRREALGFAIPAGVALTTTIAGYAYLFWRAAQNKKEEEKEEKK